MIEYATNENGSTELMPIPGTLGQLWTSFLHYRDPRWLRFDFTDASHKSLRILAGTRISFPGGTFVAAQDYVKNMGTLQAGKDYYVYLVPSKNANGGDIVASLRKDIPSDVDTTYTKNNTLRIGMFSTLCVGVGTIAGDASATTTLKNAWISLGKESYAVGDNYCRKNYSPDRDPDFYAFYNKPLLKIVTNTYYNVGYQAHPLSGFVAGNILPESVWCLTWHADSEVHAPGLVYEQNCQVCAGIYLQSGTGKNTKSAYNVSNTRSRQQINHSQDMAAIGMRLLSDQEFSNVAQGSNEKTAVKNANEASSTTSGGSVDTQGRRMISDIGCEDCCGKIWQWLREVSGIGGSGFSTYDGNGSFGQTYGVVQGLLAGGHWYDGTSCGSRARAGTEAVSYVNAYSGARTASGLSVKEWAEFWV